MVAGNAIEPVGVRWWTDITGLLADLFYTAAALADGFMLEFFHEYNSV